MLKQLVSDAVWIDGEWQWQGRRWAWAYWTMGTGRPRTNFAPWMMVRSADGAVYYAAGTWRDARHEEVAEPAALATGRPTISDVADPEGELEKTGNSIRPDSRMADGGDGLDAAPDDAPSQDASPARLERAAYRRIRAR